jgi:hypothetical protein
LIGQRGQAADARHEAKPSRMRSMVDGVAYATTLSAGQIDVS